MKNTSIIASISMLLISLFIGCKKDQSTEQELITRVRVHLEGGSGAVVEVHDFEAKDPDADGIFDTIDTIRLTVPGPYRCTLFIYDDTKNPVQDVSAEVAEENTKHLLTYRSSIDAVTVSELNKDDNGQPFGLESTWTVTGSGTGTMRISLLHEPSDKLATDPGGEVDFQVTFPLVIQ